MVAASSLGTIASLTCRGSQRGVGWYAAGGDAQRKGTGARQRGSLGSPGAAHVARHLTPREEEAEQPLLHSDKFVTALCASRYSRCGFRV